MIVLTRLNGTRFVLNSALIRTVESTPDTTVRLTTGESMIVLEPPQEVVDRTVEYERLLRAVTPAA